MHTRINNSHLHQILYKYQKKILYLCPICKYLKNTTILMIRARVPFVTCCLFFIFAFFPLNLFSQQAENGLWSSLEIKKKLGSGFALSLEEEYRQVDRLGMTDQFMTGVDLSWKPLSFLKGSIGYILINKFDATDLDPWETRHRFNVSLTGSADLGRFELSLREKLQTTRRPGVDADEHKSNPTNVLRSKFALSYNIKGLPLSPFVSSELFYTLNEPDGDQTVGSVSMFTESRWSVGVDYKFNKKLTASLGYLYSDGTDWDSFSINQVRTGRYENFYEHIITLGLSLSL